MDKQQILSMVQSTAATGWKNVVGSTWTDWIAYGTIALALHGIYALARVYMGDADLQLRSALSRLPADAFKGKVRLLSSSERVVRLL